MNQDQYPAARANQEPVAWMHDKPGRVDVMHSIVKKILNDSGSNIAEHYTLPLYSQAPKGEWLEISPPPPQPLRIDYSVIHAASEYPQRLTYNELCQMVQSAVGNEATCAAAKGQAEQAEQAEQAAWFAGVHELREQVRNELAALRAEIKDLETRMVRLRWIG